MGKITPDCSRICLGRRGSKKNQQQHSWRKCRITVDILMTEGPGWRRASSCKIEQVVHSHLISHFLRDLWTTISRPLDQRQQSLETRLIEFGSERLAHGSMQNDCQEVMFHHLLTNLCHASNVGFFCFVFFMKSWTHETKYSTDTPSRLP